MRKPWRNKKRLTTYQTNLKHEEGILPLQVDSKHYHIPHKILIRLTFGKIDVNYTKVKRYLAFSQPESVKMKYVFLKEELHTE